MIVFGLLVIAVASASPSAADVPARALTLEQAVDLAERNAPQVIQALGQMRTTAAGVRSAYAAFLPSVSLSAGSTRQLPSALSRTRVENGQVITLPDQPWSYSLGLGATLQLFDGGKRFFDLHQAHARESAARANEVSQRYAAALAVKQQFFNVLAARESEAAARAQLEQAEQQLKASIVRVRAQKVTRSDSLRAVIQVRSARLAVMDARTSLEVADASLTRVVGAPSPVTAAGADTLWESALAVEDGALPKLAEDGPAVAQAAAELSAAESARRTAWTEYLPSVSTGYSRSGNGVGNDWWPPSGAFGYSGSLRFSLSFPLFDQLQRQERLISAGVAQENAVASLRDARLAALQNLAQSLGAFHSAKERIASQTATVASAEEDLRMQQERYSLGVAILLDVLTSQTQLDQARRDLIRARYDERVAKAQLEALVGRKL